MIFSEKHRRRNKIKARCRAKVCWKLVYEFFQKYFSYIICHSVRFDASKIWFIINLLNISQSSATHYVQTFFYFRMEFFNDLYHRFLLTTKPGMKAMCLQVFHGFRDTRYSKMSENNSSWTPKVLQCWSATHDETKKLSAWNVYCSCVIYTFRFFCS